MSAVIMAVVALAHLVVDADRVFGIYAPRAVPGLLLAPLLNANHLAGLLALGLPSCIWATAQSSRVDARFCWFGATLLVFLCGVCTLSRGGVVALTLGGVCYAISLLRRARGWQWTTSTRVMVLLACSLLALTLYLAVDAAGGRLWAERGSLDKLVLIRSLLPLTLESPWTGVGRGAMGDLTAPFVPGTTRVLFAENMLVQWTAEWGLPVTIVLLAAIGATLAPKSRSRSRSAVFYGLCALGAQNLVDFSLEVMGVAVLAAAGIGLLSSAQTQPRWLYRLSTRTSLAGLLVLQALALTIAFGPSTYGSRAQLRADLEKNIDSRSGVFEAKLEEALAGYPVDPHVILLGTARAVTLGQKSASKWVNLALDVAGNWSISHIYAAHWLERLGSIDQAAIELSLAADIDPSSWRASACEFIQRHPNAQLASTAAATVLQYRQQTMEDIARCLPSDSERARLARMMLDRGIGVLAARLILVEVANRENDPTAVRLAETARDAHSDDAPAWAMLIDALGRHGQSEKALAEFERAPAAIRRSQSVLQAGASAASQLRRRDAVGRITHDLLALHGTSAPIRAELQAFASHLYRRMDEPVLALAHAQAAYELTGTPELAAMVYEAAFKAGVAQVALRMATELCHLRYQGGVYCRPSTPAP